jgi:hypothetical protein
MSNALCYLIARITKMLCNYASSSMLLQGKFWMPVKIAIYSTPGRKAVF